MTRWTRALTAAAVLIVLGGCAPIVSMKQAEDANAPECAAVIVRLPDTVGGLEKRQTDAQSTAAWGDPDQVLLRCGVPVPAASELPCIDKGIFWLRDESLEDTDNLPPPGVIAAEIVQDLEAALAEFTELAESLQGIGVEIEEG